MENKFINFAQPLITDDEIKEVVDTLRSGWITTGPKVKEFEKRVCDYTGAKYAVATFSGTSALFLSLKASGIKEDDEVIVPTFTFASTAHVVVHCGAMPVFVDSDPKTFQIDTTKIEERITVKTKAIIPVHYGGNLVEMKDIFVLARKYNLKVIEDAAHAIGSEYQGRKIGSLDSDATCFSFYATKNLATGEGGMVVTDDKELADMVRKMTMYGISDSREMWDKRYSKAGHWFYDIEMIGYKANMSDLNAAIGIQQLAKLDYFIEVRQKYSEIYLNKLRGLGYDFMETKEGNKNSSHLCP
jgi:dTDP-4-amino-4,6-dideoxygalactose transaminase